MNNIHTKYYKIERDTDTQTYRVIALKDGYNMIDHIDYFETMEEAAEFVKSEMLKDLDYQFNAII